LSRTPPAFDDHPHHLQALREAALAAADPAAAVRRCLVFRDGDLRLAGRRIRVRGRLFLIAMGKAAVPMTKAALEQVGDRLEAGIAAGPAAALFELPRSIETFAGGHPLPNEQSLAAGEWLAGLLSSVGEHDLVLALISGGGSAMLELPAPGVTLADLQKVNLGLLRSGFPISDVNVVRGALSRLKIGGLARMAAPARVAALVISDVPGDELAAVASGPTVLAPDPRRRARTILERAGLWPSMSDAVHSALSAPRPGREGLAQPLTLLVASNRGAVRAAARAARTLGFDVHRMDRPLRGEAGRVGERLARRLLRERARTCFVAGGETTVTFKTAGRGGRNQEMCLQAALLLEEEPRVAFMAFATDGIDGPTEAAGAVVTGTTAAEIRHRGLDPNTLLQAHDSFTALEAAGALIRTGPTGTNVADLVIGLKY
jgi:hydroxypyruvate reductase